MHACTNICIPNYCLLRVYNVPCMYVFNSISYWITSLVYSSLGRWLLPLSASFVACSSLWKVDASWAFSCFMSIVVLVQLTDRRYSFYPIIYWWEISLFCILCWKCSDDCGSQRLGIWLHFSFVCMSLLMVLSFISWGICLLFYMVGHILNRSSSAKGSLSSWCCFAGHSRSTAVIHWPKGHFLSYLLWRNFYVVLYPVFNQALGVFAVELQK